MRARNTLWLLLRFSLVYGALVWFCYVTTAYAWVEGASVSLVNISFNLFDADGEERTLRLEIPERGAVYVYDIKIAGTHHTISRGYHKHAFILVLFFGLALGTPGLPLRRRLIALGLGGVLTFGLCTAMLMSDLQGWEVAAFSASNLPDSDGPFPGIIMSMRGLHRTAAGGMLPIIIWAFLVAGPLLEELRPATADASGS